MPTLKSICEFLFCFDFFTGLSGIFRESQDYQGLKSCTGALLLAKSGHSIDKAPVVQHRQVCLLFLCGHLGSLTSDFPCMVQGPSPTPVQSRENVALCLAPSLSSISFCSDRATVSEMAFFWGVGQGRKEVRTRGGINNISLPQDFLLWC